MNLEEFKLRGCYSCGENRPDLFEEPYVPREDISPNATPKSVAFRPDQIREGLPVREPYLRCTNCKAEYSFSDIELLDEESWEYGRRHREGALAIPTTFYKSESQFDPSALARGFVTPDEEDVERPG